MRYTFIANKAYAAMLRSYRLTLDDARAIENAIMAGPKVWPVISGTGGVRKMRYAAERSGGGKSGGFRVCYLLLEEQYHVYLFMLYAKNDAQNVTQEQKRQMAALVRQIKELQKRSQKP
jgi:hypothetical protein